VNLQPLSIDGAKLVDIEPVCDERGFFARTWCTREFTHAGLPADVVQCSVSWNRAPHTLRGMHWQAEPHGETKLVRCTRGAIFDVLVDLRPGSPSYLRHEGIELTAENRRAVVVPPGVAHGFLTLEADTEVYYQMDTFYVPDASRGARWNDPAFGIEWPAEPAVISERDGTYPDFAPATTE
jgi:dTDP-4-dehydrorhamnose 3,5-epimerase